MRFTLSIMACDAIFGERLLFVVAVINRSRVIFHGDIARVKRNGMKLVGPMGIDEIQLVHVQTVQAARVHS